MTIGPGEISTILRFFGFEPSTYNLTTDVGSEGSVEQEVVAGGSGNVCMFFIIFLT